MASILSAIGTVLGIAALVFYQDWRDGKHLFKKNGTAESVGLLRDILSSQTMLKSHYNDDTTRILEDIRDAQREHNEIDRSIVTKLDEWEKYGVKTRTP